jgi:CDGSH-type Zn-finger protein
MTLPKVAANSPQEVQLVAGEKYAYCTCGLSEKQPFCDGKHKGTEFKPLVFTAEESKSAWFCRCKQTCNAPNCDGSHNKLSQPTPTAAAIE